MSNHDSIAIVGIGCRLPGGIDTPEEFWDILSEGREVITEVPSERWDLDFHYNADPKKPLMQHVRRGGFLDDIDRFDPSFFGITPREAVCLDPQQRLLLEVAWRSIEDAGHPVDSLRGKPVGVFIGISSSDYSSLLWASSEDFVTPDNEPFILPGNTGCIAANRLSYFFDLKGPSFTVDTACSSSLVAVHLACESILRGESELAIAGGVQALIHPGIQMSFCKAGLLSPDGRCKSFDANANGYVRSEGAGVVLLKPLSMAMKDQDQIHAVIRGTAINSDGRSQGLAAPSQRSQSACVRSAFQKAGIDPKETQYVEAHGTGTRQGDPIELRALGSVLGAGRLNGEACRLGSVKTNLGHGETVAGITGLIKATLCVRERQLPPSLHFKTPNPSVSFDELGLEVQTELASFPNPSAPLIVGVSSFGFGGTNAHVVLSDLSSNECKGKKEVIKEEPSLNLLCLSAKSKPALDELICRYVDLIKKNSTFSLNDLCGSTNLGRSLFSHRFIAVAKDFKELLVQLEGKVEPAWRGETLLTGTAKHSIDSSLEGLKLNISTLTSRNQLEALAISIGKGYKIDWEAFHSSCSYTKVCLPGHPFLRQSFWWSRNEDETSKTSLWLNHLGKIDENGSHIEKGRSFENLVKLDIPGPVDHYQGTLCPNDSPDLADHKVRDDLVFPAAGYLELALDLQQQRSQFTKISSFQLDNALKVSDKPITIHALFDDGVLSFHSNGSNEDAWHRHGELVMDSRKDYDFGKIPVITPPRQESLFIDVETFYRNLAILGFRYGPLYRSIRELCATSGEAWAEITRPCNAPDRCLLDGCFQTVAACVDLAIENGQIFLPIGVEQIVLSEWPLPNQFRCHTALRPSEDDGSTLIADLTLATNEKRFGQIVGLKLRRLTRSLIDLLFPPKDDLLNGPELFQTSWIPFELDSEEQKALTEEQIYFIGVTDEKITSFRDWSDSQNIQLHRLPIDTDLTLDATSIIFWPDLSHGQPELAVCDFLELTQRVNEAHIQSFLLVLEGEGPVSNAMAAFLRTAVLEISSCSFTVLHLPSDPVQQLTENSWSQIWRGRENHSELRWSDGLLQTPQLTRLDDDRFRITSDGSGRLEGLQKSRLRPSSLLPNEVEIAVEATGLNFRDVLNALGLLNAHASSLGLSDEVKLPFGGEAVGRVVALGPGVDPDLLGKRVVAALTIGSLASHVVARAELCVPLPKGMSTEEGASFSTAFLTAFYGLHSLADLKPGETVLIHAAAGGVGQAALQVAQRAGARVFATASTSKQSILIKQGVEAVYDSRTIDFADQVLSDTNGRGVDVVINSLKGDWVDASFRCLSKGGRFLELGKIEVWSKEDATSRRPDVRYLPFDLLEVAASYPAELRRLLLQLTKDLNEGLFKHLPIEAWPLAKCEDAFRHMAQARHVGKVVINQPDKEEPITIQPHATYLITGALGGIGLELLPWLVEKGASSFVLLGRSAETPGTKALGVLEEIRNKGVELKCINYDLSSKSIESTEKYNLLLQEIQSLPTEKPLRGIFHAAGVVNDTSLVDLRNLDVDFVMSPKLEGWRRLEDLAQDIPGLEFLIGFSSVAALLGSPGQAAYSAANGVIDGYCNKQNELLTRLSIQWGPWNGDGMAVGLERRFEGVGIHMLEPSKALNGLERLLQRGRGGVVAVLDNDWKKLANQSLPRQRSWFSALLEDLGPSPSERLWTKLKEFPEAQQKIVLMEELRKILVRVMVAESDDESLDTSSIDASDSLFNLGLDSLMAVEFAAIVQSELGIRLDLDAFSDDPSLDGLAAISLKQIIPHSDRHSNEELDLSKEAMLETNWTCPIGSQCEAPGERILITGCSGFLGAYLLAGQLERWPELRVSCLVRAQSKENGLDRIKNNLARYDLWNPSWEKRLEPIVGDLSLPSFGLDSDVFEKIAHGLGGVLHNGAQLSQMASYAQLAASNVGGTREVLRLATLESPIRVELISSVSVFEAAAYRNRVISEDDDLKDWHGIYIGYSQTKWVCERLVTKAGLSGLPITIYRPPLIGGHSKTGHWHEGDLLQRLLQGCLELGKAPRISWELDLVPVDYVSNAVSALAWSSEAKGRCFHLQHPRPLMLKDLLGQFISDGEVLKLVSMEQWLSAIDSDSKNPLYPLRPFFQRRWGAEQLTYPELNAEGIRARPSCSMTRSVLQRLNVHCPDFKDLMEPWGHSLLGSSLAITS